MLPADRAAPLPPAASLRLEAASTRLPIGKSTYQSSYRRPPLNPKATPWQTVERRSRPAGAAMAVTTGSSTHKANFVRHAPPRAGLTVDLGVQISTRPYLSMVKVAALVGPRLATTDCSGCI